ncbi:heat-shock protein 70 [Pelomyxa schiedti]|nr:heat-shock protein 70 [Pelomyxa schiedti]
MYHRSFPTKSVPTVSAPVSTPSVKIKSSASMHGSMRVETKLVCCAIDFGTSGTGFAFRDIAGVVLPSAVLSIWQYTSSPKTLTEVIIKETPTGPVVIAFGIEARNMVKNMDDEERRGIYHFRQFKMQLEGEGDRNKQLSDAEFPHRTMSLERVIQKVVEFVRDQAMTQMSRFFPNLSETSVQWVVTVPAIWDQAARLMMRDTCLQAHLSDVMIALEPEAASLAIRKDLQSELTPGTVYLMVDAGGGTVDITVHQYLSPTELRELYPPSGGMWGSTKVNSDVISFIGSIFDERGDVIEQAKQDADWLVLEDDIETKKISAEVGYIQNLGVLCIKNALVKLNKPTFSALIDKWNLSHPEQQVKNLQNMKLRLPPSVFNDLITKQAQITSNHVQHLINEIPLETKVLPKVFMVGGFAASSIYRNFIQKALPDHVVKWPNNPISAVLEGAVEFGIQPMSITQRCVPYTYAVLTSELASKHPGQLTFLTEQGQKRCHVLKTFVRYRDNLEIEEPTSATFYPLTPTQETVLFSVFKSKKKDILYPNDPDVFLVKGGLEVRNIPNVGARVEERAINVTLKFGATLIHVEAEATGSSASWSESIYSNPLSQPLYHIAFCLDESGSMKGTKWEELKEAVNAFVTRRLEKFPDGNCGDTACIVTYSSTARIRRPNGPLSSLQRHPLHSRSGGGTSFAAGLKLCDTALMQARGTNNFGGRTPILILMSDGLCKNGLAEMKLIHSHYKDCGLKTFVVGFGTDVDTAQLESLAAAVGGYISFGRNGTELLHAFTHISSSLCSQFFNSV